MTTGLPVQALVRAFHDRNGFTASDRPALPGAAVAEQRVALMSEELDEFREAARAGDLVGVADALADLAYVVYGTAVTYGIDLDAVVAEVHRSNMTKMGVVAGKAAKAPGYEAPVIAPILAAQGAPPTAPEESDA